MANNETTQSTAPSPKKTNKTFIIVLILLVVGGAWFGITKYNYAQHHEGTDDAQIEANISPVIPRISGYVAKVFVKDNQMVKKGDTLLVLDDRDVKNQARTGRSSPGYCAKQPRACQSVYLCCNR